MHLGLSGWTEAHRVRDIIIVLYHTKLLLIFLDIVSQCSDETLGVLGCEDDARLDLGLWDAWHETHIVDDKLLIGVCYDRKVRIYPLGYLLGQFYIDLILLFGVLHLVCHIAICDF